MADSNRTAVTAVAIIAIVILVGLVAYFVMEETDDTIDIDLGQLDAETPSVVADRLPVPSRPAFLMRA
jgi:hypothetical protein